MTVKKEILRLIDITVFQNGAIAQLVEHLHGMQGVSGSNPLGSINYKNIIHKKCFFNEIKLRQ